MGMPPQGFMPSYTLPSQQLSSMTMVDPHAPSLGQDHDLDMKGSYSAPGNAPLLASEAEEQQQNGNLGEKKRNKLGYHRTSVTAGAERSDASRRLMIHKDAVSTAFV
ncbi:hypothetical protein LB505_005220 [Fusarium chuoi]|nr:hypothetical protein LB505_005220 [Fusarium chuoi]